MPEGKTQGWREQLAGALAGARSLVVLGIGNELYQDDGAGVMLARSLVRSGFRSPKRLAIEAGPAPENFTGSVRRFSPSHVLMVDAADMNLKPGSIRKIEPDEITGAGFCTHTLPLHVLADYFSKEGFQVVVAGIQPKRVFWGSGISPEVAGAVARMAAFLKELKWQQDPL